MLSARRALPCALFFLIAATLAGAQTPGRVERRYEVQDLIRPCFPPPPEAAASAASKELAQAQEAEARSKAAAALLLQIQDGLSTPPWDLQNLLQIQDHQLVALADEAGQRRLGDLLATLRKNTMQIQIEARFFTVDNQALAALALPAPQQVQLLDARQARELGAAVSGRKDATLLSAPRIILWTGQTGYIQIGQEQAYVADYKIQMDRESKPLFKPEMASFPTGIRLDVLALLSADRQHIVLTLHPLLTELKGLTRERLAGAPAGQDLLLEKPLLERTEGRLVAAVPVDQSLVTVLPGAVGSKAPAVILMVKASALLPAAP